MNYLLKLEPKTGDSAGEIDVRFTDLCFTYRLMKREEPQQRCDVYVSFKVDSQCKKHAGAFN